MLCDVCKKKKAMVHYTEVVNDKIRKLNLCEECAVSKGIGNQPPFSMGELLGGLTPPGFDISTKEKVSVCPGCGMTFREFKTGGRLGCAQCYEAFKEALMPLINNIHKSTRHTGKAPGAAKGIARGALKIKELEGKLRDAVKKEEFELAAQIRDKIRAMHKKGIK